MHTVHQFFEVILTYISLSDYLKQTFGCKVYRLSLSSGCSCPNRDGTVGVGGCFFCSEGGSGDFASHNVDMDLQIDEAKKKVDSKFSKKTPESERRYIAYFQSFTNTYAPVDFLRKIFTKAINRPEVVALSIGTRPDCISDEILCLLESLNKIKPVWVELGLQTIHEKTAKAMNRCYSLKVFDECYFRLKNVGIKIIVHVILYLPGETKEDMLATCDYLSNLTPVLDGIKIQLLHVLEGTKLCEIYRKEPFHLPTLEEYSQFIPEYLSHLNPATVIHRLTGDGPKKILVAPLWTGDKKKVMNTLKKSIEKYQNLDC